MPQIPQFSEKESAITPKAEISHIFKMVQTFILSASVELKDMWKPI